MTTVLVVAVQMKFPFINGPSYWSWWYQWIAPKILIPTMALAAAPVILAAAGYQKRWWNHRVALALILVGAFLMMNAASWIQPKVGSWKRPVRITRSIGASSTMPDALRLYNSGQSVRKWLRDYPRHMPELFVHSRVRAPGLILFHLLFIRLLGPSPQATYVVVIVIGLLTAGSLLGLFWLINVLTNDRDAAICGTVVMAMCPGYLLFFPEFDAVYPLATCGMVGFWALAVRTQHWKWSIATGASIAMATFFTYIPLLLGVFLLGYGVLCLKRLPGWNRRQFLLHSMVALATLVSLYAIFWIATGFNPIDTFRTAAGDQKVFFSWITKRPYHKTVIFDQTDFALGAGWICLLLVAFAIVRLWHLRDRRLSIILLCLAQIEVAALTGLTPGETARLWVFMFPLLMIPVGIELAKWDFGSRLTFYLCQWALLTVICGRLMFVGVEPLELVPDWLLMKSLIGH